METNRAVDITVQDVIDLVNDVQDRVVEFEIARQHLALYGWVLHDTYPVIAQNIKSRQCASCENWCSPSFHMGVIDGFCSVKNDHSGDEDTCESWKSAIKS